MAIELLGGECVECKGTEKLQFDHIDKASKSFPISKALRSSFERMLEELKKCQLLCQQCHIDKHRIDFSENAKRNNMKRGLDYR